MNPVNKKALYLTKTTEEDFLEYCKADKKNKTSNKTRQIYFKKILNDSVVREEKSGKIKILKDE